MVWHKFPRLSKKEIQEAKKDRKKARFLVDENVDSIVLDSIKKSGFNAVSVHDIGISGHPDENVLAFAKRDDRVLITHDSDFLDDQKYPYSHNPGIVVLPDPQGNTGILLAALNDVKNIIGISRNLWSESKVIVTQDGVWTVFTYERDEGQIVKNRYRLSPNGMEHWVEGS